MGGSAEAMTQAVVTFHLGGLVFGIDSALVAEVVPNAWMDRPPALPSMVAGLLDLGGRAVVVLRGDRLLGLPDQVFGLDASILIMKGEDFGLGLLTGRVGGVRDLTAGTVLPVDTAHSFQGCLRGQLGLADATVVNLLDWSGVLLAGERARLDEFRQRAAERLELWQDGAS